METNEDKHGKTRTIRVPIVLADSILDLARILDEGKEVPEKCLVTDKVERGDSLDTDNNNELIKELNTFDVSAAIDALTTAISMKQIAISKESKKRSKVDTTTIAKWHKEIESIERTGARSALLQAVRISQINLDRVLS